MAEANRKTTFDSPANREDLQDIVYNVDPWETPFYTRIPTAGATAMLHQWPIDELAAPSGSNAAIEGDDLTIQASVNPTRATNQVQIFTKTLMVSSSQQAVLQAGVDDEIDYQLVKKTKEIRTDIETVMLSDNVKSAGNKTTASTMAGYGSYCLAGYNGTGTGPTGGDGSTAPVAGTARAFDETILRTNLADIWDNGGSVDMIVAGKVQKSAISGFSGYADRVKTAEDRRLVAAIDIYESDFHDSEVVACRHIAANRVFTVQTDMWASAELLPLYQFEMGKTGIADKWGLECQLTLEARNQKASGQIRDLT